MDRVILSDSQSYVVQNEDTDALEAFAREHGYVEPVCAKGRDNDEPFTYMLFDKGRGMQYTYMENTIELIKEKLLESEKVGGDDDGNSGSI